MMGESAEMVTFCIFMLSPFLAIYKELIDSLTIIISLVPRPYSQGFNVARWAYIEKIGEPGDKANKYYIYM